MTRALPTDTAESFEPLDDTNCSTGKVTGNENTLDDLVSYHVARVLKTMRESDTFDIVLYSGTAEKVFDQAVVATKENVDKAIERVKCEPNASGTASGEGLKLAYTIKDVDHLYFITDARPNKKMSCNDILTLVTERKIPVNAILLTPEDQSIEWHECDGFTAVSWMEEIALSTGGTFIENPVR